MISRNIAGCPRPVGSSFEWREIWAARGYKDPHNVPWKVCVVDSKRGPIIEAKFHLDFHAIVATDIASHSLSVMEGVLQDARSLLGKDGWKTGVVQHCTVDGCPNPLPMWLSIDDVRRPAVSDRECLSCSMRTVMECDECGAPDPGRWAGRERLLTGGLCFHCDAWSRRVHDSPEIVTEEYGVYSIGSGRGPKHCHGFGGAEFVVTFFDGRVVATDDLWSGGAVPEWFRDRFTPNATVAHITPRPKATVA